MEQEPHRPLPGDDDPLDAALGELQDLAELERSFADLDARLGDGITARRASREDDPFADIAAALREHRVTGGDPAADTDDSDEDSTLLAGAPMSRFEAANSDDDDDDDSDSVDAFLGVDLEAAELATEIEQLCQDALDALEADDLPLAREVAMGAVRLDDEHPFPIFVLGLVAEREGDLDTARDMAELALRSAETNPDAIGLRAHIHVSQHQFNEAEALLRFGIAHNPDEAMLHEGLARVELARGRHAAALNAANAALRLEPSNPGAMAVRSAALEEASDRQAVLAALRQGVMLHPEDPYGMVELASMEMEHGNLDRARSLLMRASRLAPRDREIGDVRVLVDHLHTHRLLRPVPGLLRWLREFPGGLPGFLIGLLVTALPMHALAVANPTYRAPVTILLGIWGAVALYAWIAPARLTHRLNQRAAAGARDRIERDLGDPLAPVPSPEQSTDALAMLVDARERRGAMRVTRQLLDRMPDESDSAAGVREFEARLRSMPVRIGMSVLTLPGLARTLVAIAGVLFVIAPTLAEHVGLMRDAWYAIGLFALTAAWGSHALGRRTTEQLDESLAQVRVLGEGVLPLGASWRRPNR